MNEQKNNGRGIFYGVIGVATLVVAIIGATFAYFTATASNTATITGNMATIKLSLAVDKVTHVDEAGGMIPMSNGMVETAIQNDDNQVCVDDNGNAVCQVYKITLTNDSSAAQFVDGYVALKGGSGAPTDYTSYKKETTTTSVFPMDGLNGSSTTLVGTTMRWAQVFEDPAGKYKEGETEKTETDYTTSGTQNLGATAWYTTISADGRIDGTDDTVPTTVGSDDTGNKITLNADQLKNPTFASIGSSTDGKNVANIKTASADVVTGAMIQGSGYPAITMNYIRVSDHQWGDGSTAESFDRTKDITSALVFNQSVGANSSVSYFFVVWLSETGTNQTAGEKTGATDADKNPAANSFFAGNVTFISAQGSEVSATFNGYARAGQA